MTAALYQRYLGFPDLRSLLPPPESVDSKRAAAPSSGYALMTAGYDLRVQ
jgi:hypothetical protein